MIKGEPYTRAGGDVVCDDCGKQYREHPNEKAKDSFDGQDLDLYRLCDGRLVKL